MHILQLARTTFSIFVGVAATLAISLWTLIRADKNGPRLWSQVLRNNVLGPIANIDFQTEENFRPIEDDELVVIYANHQSTAALSEFNHYVIERFGRNPVYIVKKDLYPWILWPIDRIGIAVKIDRDDPEAAERALQEALPGIIEKKQVIVIFPDSSRWTPKKAAQQLAKFNHVPQAAEILENTLMPRPKGLFQIIDAIGDRPYRLFEIANGFDIRLESLPAAVTLFGATFCAMTQEVDPRTVPKDAKERSAWLNDRYLRISRKLGTRRHSKQNYGGAPERRYEPVVSKERKRA